MNEKTYWGYHLSVDGRTTEHSKAFVKNVENIKKFNSALIKAIDMVPYGEPQLVHFGTHEPGLGGWTLVQLIETSNIMAHFVDDTGEFYIDVFSCKTFNPTIALEVIDEYFQPLRMEKRFFTRKG